MPAFFNKLFSREHPASKKGPLQSENLEPKEAKYEDGWLRTEVSCEEVRELLRACTVEIKSRGLSTPFLLLPFRPNTDACAARTLVRNFFNIASGPLSGELLARELRLSELDVLCSTVKWCWSRLPGGVVTWEVYELFRQGEVDSSMARDSFATFIPISAESQARSDIIFDFFDLLSATAAHAKHNGLGGMKLSRLSGWWAFEHSDLGWGFEGGYATWERAADASCHLFFAYLRSLSPADTVQGVSMLPTSLKALLANTDYPPVAPRQLQSRTSRVVISVDTVSPTPFALLRRAKHFQYHYPETEHALRAFSEHQDPVQALSEECKRVLRCISSANQSSAGSYKFASGVQEQSWSRFQDIGFSGIMDESESDEDGPEVMRKRRTSTEPTPLTPPQEEFSLARPTTPSWADFMSSGFGERAQINSPTPLLLPPDKILPPIETASRAKSSQSNRKIALDNLDPGELASVSPQNIDDAFWWVWISSLAGEETAVRKAAFGRCALAETSIRGGKWLVVEEKVKGAAAPKEDAVYLASKKAKKKSKRTKLMRRRGDIIRDEILQTEVKRFDPSTASLSSRTNIGPDQTAKIQAAAAALRQQQADQEFSQLRRQPVGNREKPSTRTNSVFTLQPVIMSEATPAMKWASKYDRDALREAYLSGTLPPKPSSTTTKTERELPAPPEEQEVEHTEPEVPKPTSPTSIQRKPLPSSSSVPPSVNSQSLPPSPTATRQPVPPSPFANGRSSPVDKRRSLPADHKPTPVAHPAERNAKPKVSRLRQMFAKKAEPSGPSAPIAPSGSRPSGEAGNLAVPSNNIGRRLSMGRKKHSPIDVSTYQKTPSDKADATDLARQPESKADASPVSANAPSSNNQTDHSEPTRSQEEAAAKVFSSFDQGPLEDQPAFVPDSAEGSTLESPVSPDFPERQPPVPPKDGTPADTPSESPEPSPEPSPPVSPIAPVHDRWAQIRANAAKNAAKRAAQENTAKASEASSKTDVTTSADDAETSGEETIESRVARIRARVAELSKA